MIQVRKSEDRGHANHGWLDSHHTFSFANYFDPKFMGFRTLRVINEDRVSAGQGFGMHPHRDMEILSYVLEGSLAHKDSMGREEVLGPNEIQRMSAGTGIMHSEFNPSPAEPVHFFQIWIEPNQRGAKPDYQQTRFDPEQKKDTLLRLAGPAGSDALSYINQDAHIFVSAPAAEVQIPYVLRPGRAAWVHSVRGAVSVNGVELQAGDAAAVTGEKELRLSGTGAGTNELLLFDVV